MNNCKSNISLQVDHGTNKRKKKRKRKNKNKNKKTPKISKISDHNEKNPHGKY